MRYQQCRWYDIYPGLAFVLKLIRLMPEEKQSFVGNRLNQYLSYRSVTDTIIVKEKGNRWYDQVPSLLEGLERLKSAPHPVKQQSTEFLIRLLEEPESSEADCA